MDKLKSMKVFVAVAKAGSFAQGARDLSISRAMATKHIMFLEQELGTRLFNRTTRSLSLTEVGASYFERCQQLLLDIEEMEAAVTHLQTEPRGFLKISAPPVIGAVHIAPAMAEFIKIYPELEVEMVLQGALSDLVNEGIDIAIYYGELEDTSLVARKLISSPLVVCAAPEYLQAHGIPLTPEELKQHSCLINWAVSPKDQWTFRWAGEDVVIKVSGHFHANMSDPIRIAAIRGLGLVMLPKYIVGRDIEKGKLTVVLADYAKPPLGVYALYPHRKYLSAKVSIFLDFLNDWFAREANLVEETNHEGR